MTFNVGSALPVGTILPWDKDLTGVPSLPPEFAECNGQTLSDANSPLDGQTLPNLNSGNRFVRGNSTSGGTGGADASSLSHSHSIVRSSGSDVKWRVTSNDQAVYYDDVSWGGTGNFMQDVTDSSLSSTDNKPPYYDAVMVIKVK